MVCAVQLMCCACTPHQSRRTTGPDAQSESTVCTRRELSVGADDGHGGIRQRKGGSRERRTAIAQEDVPAGGSQRAPRKQLAGMFSNSVRSSVVRKSHKAGQSQRVHQKRFSESEFFLGDHEHDKENAPAADPESVSGARSRRGDRQASLAFDSLEEDVDYVGEEEKMSVLGESVDQDSGPPPSLTGKILERKLLVQQMVASSFETEVSEEEARLEAFAAANYRACRKVADSSENEGLGAGGAGRVTAECIRFEQGALQALAQLHDFYRVQSASPTVSQFQTPTLPISEPRRAFTSASRPPSHPSSATQRSVQRTLRGDAHAMAARSVSREAEQPRPMLRSAATTTGAAGGGLGSMAFRDPRDAPLFSGFRFGGFAAPTQFVSPRLPYQVGSALDVGQGLPAVSSSDDTIAQSMMLPDVWTP